MYSGSFTITPHTTENGKIGEWLMGHITVGLSGEYISSFKAISEKRAASIEAYKKEKIKESAKIAARSEAKKAKARATGNAD